MGKDAFCKYFLFPQNIYSTEELQEHTGLSQEEIKKVQDFVDTLSLLPERVSPVFSSAKIVARMENELILLSPAYRTHYSINSKRCSKFIKDLKGKEKEKAQELLRKIKVLNTQKTVLFRLLEEIMQHQAEYLSTGDESKLKILTQRDVAQSLGVHPSWINRLIKQKYVETVWGTKPLRFFFQSKRDYLKRHLKELLEREWASDAELARILHESTGYKVRRRNLASMRKELWSQRA
jgi:DNA-directed RNA polymerase specialized sigma54-like protein